MSTEDDREKSREESPKWHRARAARLRANGFEKMAEEHEQIAEIIERRRREQENKYGHYSKALTCGSGGTDAGSARG